MKKVLLIYEADKLVAIDEDWESHPFEAQWTILKIQ